MKTKAQSPAFLFYTNDFISGTQFFSDEQLGKFLRLLCAQHQHGHLSEKQVIHISKSHDIEVMSKFIKDADGNYFNERLEFEINRRENFVASRGKNKEGKTKSLKKHKKIISKSYDNHMDNENEIENRNDKEKETEISEFEKTFSSFIEMRKKIKKPATDHAIELIKKKLDELAMNDESLQIAILNQSIRNSWQDVFPIKIDNSRPVNPADMKVAYKFKPLPTLNL